jgi:hypothetical protein
MLAARWDRSPGELQRRRQAWNRREADAAPHAVPEVLAAVPQAVPERLAAAPQAAPEALAKAAPRRGPEANERKSLPP